MSRPERTYVLDSNLFIAGFRDAEANRALQDFHRLFAPFEYLAAVVAQELRAGARTEDAWQRAGDVLARLARRDGPHANRRDFERIAGVVRFEFVDPWPTRG